MANEALYTNSNSTQFTNAGLNPYPSLYATTYGQSQTDLVKEDMRSTIFDSAPQQFYDLKIMNINASERKNMDEFSWTEKGYGRDALQALSAVAGGGSQITIPISLSAMSTITIDTIVGFPNGQKGNLIAKNNNTNTITVQMQTGMTAPSVSNGDIINNFSSIEPDAVNNYSQNFRAITVKRYNFIQNFVKGMRFGDKELEKYIRSGTTDYLDINRREFIRQFRIDISNVYWAGVMGQVNMSYGTPAKTADGLYSLMTKSSSPQSTTTLANVGSGLEAIALDTEFGETGEVKFCYMTPTMKNYIAKYYKYSLLRYNLNTGDTTATAGGSTAALSLDCVDIGSTRMVLVPFKRLEDTASFPISWQRMVFVIDQKNIIPVNFSDEHMTQTPNRKTGLNLKTYTNYVMDADFSIIFNNPLSSGILIAN